MDICHGCGRELKEGEVNYGVDGLSYCSSCIGISDTKPCYKCGIRLPPDEMRRYKSQYYCQYCFMEEEFAKRDEERVRDELAGKIKYRKESEHITERHGERCERCGTLLSTIYLVNGMHLCEACAKEEFDKYHPSKRPKASVIKIRNPSVIEVVSEHLIEKPKRSIIRIVKEALGWDKEEPEIVAVTPKNPMSIANVLDDNSSEQKLKPMVDKDEKKKDDEEEA